MSLNRLFDRFKRTQQSEKRVSVIGTVESGKTTALGLICLTCQTLSAQNIAFKSRIRERTSGIKQAPSDLRRGHFPPKTTPGSYYEADLLLKKEGHFGDRTVTLPFCETAGEDIQKWINSFSQSMYVQRPKHHVVDELYKYVLNSEGFILVCPTSRALMHTGSQPLEAVPTGTSNDPDVNLSRIVDAIYDYKQQANMKIEGIAVLTTKQDIIQPYAQSMGVDLTNPQGMQKFMTSFFPDTSQSLKWYGLDKIMFFPSWVQVERQQDGSPVKWQDGSEKILMNIRRPRMPQYSEQSYMNLVNWLVDTFAVED